MRKIEKASLAIACALLLSCLCLAQTGKVETIEPVTDTAVPDAVRQILEPKGFHLSFDDGTSAELWLRKNIPAQPKKDSADVIYTEIPESTLVGVLHFTKPASDFRGQEVSAGFYTLRYALIPNDGNHLGVSPNRDFLLLVPAASDADPNATFKSDQLMEMSRKAAGTRHPAPLSLVPPVGKDSALSKDDQDHWIFSIGAKLASGQELPLSVVIKGTAQQ